ncbi:MAG: transglycosylase domain-containing protein, partial [Anaerolineales bacterium]|nr:transglycosylase domain-containing protein [Anaerolineales bacterium]
MANDENEKDTAASRPSETTDQTSNQPTNQPTRDEDHIETISLLDLMAEMAEENERPHEEEPPPLPDEAPTQTVFPPQVALSADEDEDEDTLTGAPAPAQPARRQPVPLPLTPEDIPPQERPLERDPDATSVSPRVAIPGNRVPDEEAPTRMYRPVKRPSPEQPEPTRANQPPRARPSEQPPRPSGQPPRAAPAAAATRPAAQPVPRVTVPTPGRSAAPPKPRRRRDWHGCLVRLAVFGFIGFILLSIVGVLAAAVGYTSIARDLPSVSELEERVSSFETARIYDRYGSEIYALADPNTGNRTRVSLDEISPYLIQATIATEDSRFYENPGFDPIGLTRAIFQAMREGEQIAGTSTITQQLVRAVLLDEDERTERTARRKIREIILAAELARTYDKNTILELYLNEIYYGNLAYGAQAAAQTFFGKDVQDLTLGEAALLAGLPQAPADLDPLNPDPVVQDRVYNRWRQVLGEMVEEGYITAAERDTALRQGLNFVVPETNNLRVPHFTVYAQNEFADIMNELGFSPDEITRGGYRIYTTVDQEIYTLALGAARTQVANLQANNVSNAAVIVLQPLTGQIIAMVGSVDYNSDAIDGRVNVTIALRQPGSTMKPFTYATALELGMTAGDVIWDTPTEIGIPGQEIYRPRNYDGAFHGPMTMRMALANSYNIPAVQTTRLIGVDTLLSTMNRVGVSTLGLDASQYGLSLTLGGGEVSLLEFANAYGVFANQGAYVEPTSILCIVDSDGSIVYQYENGCPPGAGTFTAQTVDRRGFGTQVMDPRVAYVITDILSDNAARTPAMGSRSALYTPNIATSVKTGTTNDVKDNWTVGYTRNVVVGVWVG